MVPGHVNDRMLGRVDAVGLRTPLVGTSNFQGFKEKQNPKRRRSTLMPIMKLNSQRMSWLPTVALGFAVGTAGCNDSHNDTATPPEVTPATHNAATCADPIRLAAASTLQRESTAQAADGLSAEADPNCTGFRTHGPDRVYKLSLPATGATKLKATVAPSASAGADAFDPVLYATTACTRTPACVVGSDAHGAGGAEALEYINTTGAAQDLYIVVDGYDFQPAGGNYQLTINLSAP